MKLNAGTLNVNIYKSSSIKLHFMTLTFLKGEKIFLIDSDRSMLNKTSTEFSVAAMVTRSSRPLGIFFAKIGV